MVSLLTRPSLLPLPPEGGAEDSGSRGGRSGLDGLPP